VRFRTVLRALIVSALCVSPSASQAQPGVALVPIAIGVEQPISSTVRPGDDTLYVVEKTGRLRAVVNDMVREQPVLDLRSLVSTKNERGLLQAAFPPGPPSFVYVTYAALDGAWTLAEYAFDGTNADPATGRIVLQLPHPNDDHYGGSLAFTSDGLLLVGLGDGGGVGTKGGVGDVANNAQRLDRWFGKLLRIDPRRSTDGTRPYTVPDTNPFASGRVPGSGLGATAKALPEIYAYGLRNPWRIHLEPSGVLWIADTGQASWEEVNRVTLDQARGANFGWRLREGTKGYRGGAKPKGAIDPVYEFPHDGRCAVIGGAVARVGSLAGAYVHGDLCTGTFYAVRPLAGGRWTGTKLPVQLRAPTSIGVDARGELVVTGFYNGVHRLRS
jgi:glucose/arabinose dehydrogenase